MDLKNFHARLTCLDSAAEAGEDTSRVIFFAGSSLLLACEPSVSCNLVVAVVVAAAVVATAASACSPLSDVSTEAGRGDVDPGAFRLRSG